MTAYRSPQEQVPYVWVVQDKDTGEIWLYYDGETARKFRDEHIQQTGNKTVYCDKEIVY